MGGCGEKGCHVRWGINLHSYNLLLLLATLWRLDPFSWIRGLPRINSSLGDLFPNPLCLPAPNFAVVIPSLFYPNKFAPKKQTVSPATSRYIDFFVNHQLSAGLLFFGEISHRGKRDYCRLGYHISASGDDLPQDVSNYKRTRRLRCNKGRWSLIDTTEWAARESGASGTINPPK